MKLKDRNADSAPAGGPPEDGATLQGIAKRFEKIERAVARIERHSLLLPAIVRRLCLSDVELPPPYDLQAERFAFLSQNEEDGLLLALFKRFGMTDRRFVEIGCGMNGGNSGFLAQECGWSGLMVDAKAASIEKVKIRFTGHAVRAETVRVTRENVNTLLTNCGLTGELDLLSIDIDGMDYWVWEAVTACKPRIVAIEYNWLFRAERAVTIPYDADFDVSAGLLGGYRGASLAALVHLGRRKGYRLVATEHVNAFFLRNDLAPEYPEIDVARGCRVPLNVNEGKNVFDQIEEAGLPLVTVSGDDMGSGRL